MTRQIELTALAWALVGYIALQIGLNLLSMYRVTRAAPKRKALLLLLNAFQANVLNALYFLARNDRVTMTALALLRDAQRKDVVLGLTNDFEAQVVSGLIDTSVVILAPESNLAEGQRVTPANLDDE